MRLFATDIREKKEFIFQGDLLKFSEYYPQSNRYLYERYFNRDGKWVLYGYEVVIPVKHRNPDGTISEVYPSSEKFGTHGWFIPKNGNLDVYLK